MRTKNICISIIYGSGSGYHKKIIYFWLGQMRTKNICISIIIYGLGAGTTKKLFIFGYVRSEGKGDFFFMKWELVVICLYISGLKTGKEPALPERTASDWCILTTYHIR